ncbi:hypothetical protein RCO28_27630 [Streptomyces sp. LHD-70]|uniref:Acb2/Tad1 domain-containing protein n=1 Tax=Streptomyces sp. LHD-70 TaxID=3072140 RepID=UPI00280CFF2C|nr:hypothetical protein [Streptomyces sp. LHD-70]MDQ8706212.1 hypothetical protein [Streptomyces sp. LHD-70]
MSIDAQELLNRFMYHPPRGDQVERYGHQLRVTAHSFAHVIDQLAPDSREKSQALTKLEEAVCYANAAIARREDAQ